MISLFVTSGYGVNPDIFRAEEQEQGSYAICRPEECALLRR